MRAAGDAPGHAHALSPGDPGDAEPGVGARSAAVSAFCGFPWVDEADARAGEVGCVAGRECGIQGPADSGDLGIGGADRMVGVFSSGDDVGVLICGEDVEGLDLVAEICVDERVDGFR